MLIFEVISAALNEKSRRKYKCTSGPRKGQRVAKISTCSAPVNRRSNSYDEVDEPRKYVPKDKKKKDHEKKKVRPHRANIKSESQVNEYGGTGGGNIPGKSKVISTNALTTTIKNDDNSETKVDNKELTPLPDGSIVRNTTKQDDPKKSIRPGAKVIQTK
jgi:hypothetical protein